MGPGSACRVPQPLDGATRSLPRRRRLGRPGPDERRRVDAPPFRRRTARPLRCCSRSPRTKASPASSPAFGLRSRRLPIGRRRALVGGLEPAQVYWYRFTDETGAGSRVGRTITAPALDDPRSVRFAFVSCQSVNEGAQNAYRRMIWEDRRAPADQRLGFVLHLGDFIYEVVEYPDEVSRRYDRTVYDIGRIPEGRKVQQLPRADLARRLSHGLSRAHRRPGHPGRPRLVSLRLHRRQPRVLVAGLAELHQISGRTNRARPAPARRGEPGLVGIHPVARAQGVGTGPRHLCRPLRRERADHSLRSRRTGRRAEQPHRARQHDRLPGDAIRPPRRAGPDRPAQLRDGVSDDPGRDRCAGAEGVSQPLSPGGARDPGRGPHLRRRPPAGGDRDRRAADEELHARRPADDGAGPRAEGLAEADAQGVAGDLEDLGRDQRNDGHARRPAEPAARARPTVARQGLRVLRRRRLQRRARASGPSSTTSCAMRA